jgi:hypothetical protein
MIAQWFSTDLSNENIYFKINFVIFFSASSTEGVSITTGH